MRDADDRYPDDRDPGDEPWDADLDAYRPPDPDPDFERRFRFLLGGVWLFGLAVVLLQGINLLGYLLLTAYAAGILYAFSLRLAGDPDGDSGVLWAVFLPPFAWITFTLHWLDHRDGVLGNPPDPGPGPEDADLLDDGAWDDETEGPDRS